MISIYIIINIIISMFKLLMLLCIIRIFSKLRSISQC